MMIASVMIFVAGVMAHKDAVMVSAAPLAAVAVDVVALSLHGKMALSARSARRKDTLPASAGGATKTETGCAHTVLWPTRISAAR